jgi:hypothetical protein
MPALLLQATFNVGAALIMARVGDYRYLLPVLPFACLAAVLPFAPVPPPATPAVRGPQDSDPELLPRPPRRWKVVRSSAGAGEIDRS